MKAKCPECGWSKEVTPQKCGKKAECPQCGNIFRVGGVKNRKAQKITQTEAINRSAGDAKEKGNHAADASRSLEGLASADRPSHTRAKSLPKVKLIGLIFMSAILGGLVASAVILFAWPRPADNPDDQALEMPCAKRLMDKLTSTQNAFKAGISYRDFSADYRELVDAHERFRDSKEPRQIPRFAEQARQAVTAYGLLSDVWELKFMTREEITDMFENTGEGPYGLATKIAEAMYPVSYGEFRDQHPKLADNSKGSVDAVILFLIQQAAKETRKAKQLINQE